MATMIKRRSYCRSVITTFTHPIGIKCHICDKILFNSLWDVMFPCLNLVKKNIDIIQLMYSINLVVEVVVNRHYVGRVCSFNVCLSMLILLSSFSVTHTYFRELGWEVSCFATIKVLGEKHDN